MSENNLAAYQLTKFPIKCWYRESTSEWIAEIEYCSIGGSFNTSRYPNKSLTVAVVELLEHLKKEGVLCNVPSQN